jgi:hypothetical protein
MLLPLELYGPIASFCDDDTLSRLARTSRDVSAVSLRELYNLKAERNRLPLLSEDRRHTQELAAILRSDMREQVICHGVLECRAMANLYIESRDGSYQ